MNMLALPQMSALEAQLRDKLQFVLDPELGRSVVDLGLIYRIDQTADRAVAIDMTTTTRFCPASVYLVHAVRACVLESGLVDSVDVNLVYDPPWTVEMMAD
jgi:metal-sulfur cluster biosynthetic enzyme